MHQALKTFYRRAIPDQIRYPIGKIRRSGLDSVRRLATPGPLPPRRLLQYVQMTPWIEEYLRVGELSHQAVCAAFEKHGLGTVSGTRILDFGCGLGRTLRHFRHDSRELSGCDIDSRLIDWTRRAFPAMDVRLSSPSPPLPWTSSNFDGLFAISVFTHFNMDQQREWSKETHRLLCPGGLAVITTMGPHALGGFPNLATSTNRETLEERGFLFHSGGREFNANGAFHTADGIREIFGPTFELEEWAEGGLDGFQDLSVLRRRSES